MSNEAAPLVGRAKELDALASFIDDIAKERGGSLLLIGEAGIGKSRLLDVVEASAIQKGVRVVRGNARELEQERSFGPFIDAFQSLDADDPDGISRTGLHTDLTRTISDAEEAIELRFRLQETIIDTLEKMSERTPLLLILDDLQWVDPASSAVVARVAANARFQRLGVVTASRPFPLPMHVTSTLDQLAKAKARRVKLGPLDEDEVRSLVQEMVGASPGPGLMEQAAQAGGNPLYVNELITALADEGAFQEGPEGIEASTREVPASFKDAVLHRLSFLDDTTVRCLEAGVMLGPAFSVADLQILLEEPAERVLAMLRPALASGLLREEGNHLALRHTLIHQALYEHVPSSARRALHVEIARKLASSNRPPEQVASHFARGAESGDAEAIAWLRRAAEDLSVHAPDVACDLLTKAVDLSINGSDIWSENRLELAEKLVWAGRPQEAEPLARELMAQGGQTTRARARAILIAALQMDSRLSDAAEELEIAAQDQLPDTERARLMSLLAISWFQTGDMGRARTFAEEARSLGESLNDGLAVCGARCALGMVLICEGRMGEALETLREAVAIADSDGSPSTRRMGARWHLGSVLLLLDRFEEAAKEFRTELRQAEQLGFVWLVCTLHGSVALTHLLAGELEDARSEFETAVRVANESGVTNLHGHTFEEARVAIYQNDLARARRQLERAGAMPTEADWPLTVSPYRSWLWLLLEESEGHGEVVERIVSDPPGEGSWWATIGPDFVQISLRHGLVDQAAGFSGEIERAAELVGSESSHAAALIARAMLRSDPALAREAVSLYDRTPLPLFRALARVCAAEIVDGDAERVELLTQALALYEASSAHRDSASVLGRLRELGVRPSRGGRHSRPRTGWASLTETETRVVELVGRGLTYKQIAEQLFVSRRTVESHIAHVFEKLGLGSRAELAAALADKGAAAPQ